LSERLNTEVAAFSILVVFLGFVREFVFGGFWRGGLWKAASIYIYIYIDLALQKPTRKQTLSLFMFLRKYKIEISVAQEKSLASLANLRIVSLLKYHFLSLLLALFHLFHRLSPPKTTSQTDP
jgi:hypothetical protein